MRRLQTAPEQDIDPVVGDASFPAAVFAASFQRMLIIKQPAIKIPWEDVEAINILRTVEIEIPILGIRISHEDLEGHPVGDVLLVEPVGHQLI